MKLLHICCLLALACGVATAQTAAPTSAPVPALSNSSSSDGRLVTMEELEAIIEEIKAEIKDDPAFAKIFENIDLDALLQMTPEEAREELIAKVFDATAPPVASDSGSGSGSVGSSSGGEDDVTKEPTPSVPAPSSAVAAAPTVALAVASAIVYVLQ